MTRYVNELSSLPTRIIDGLSGLARSISYVFRSFSPVMLPAANVGATSATRKNWPRKNRSNSLRATPELTCRVASGPARPVEVDQRPEERPRRRTGARTRGASAGSPAARGSGRGFRGRTWGFRVKVARSMRLFDRTHFREFVGDLLLMLIQRLRTPLGPDDDRFRPKV